MQIRSGESLSSEYWNMRDGKSQLNSEDKEGGPKK